MLPAHALDGLLEIWLSQIRSDPSKYRSVICIGNHMHAHQVREREYAILRCAVPFKAKRNTLSASIYPAGHRTSLRNHTHSLFPSVNRSNVSFASVVVLTKFT